MFGNPFPIYNTLIFFKWTYVTVMNVGSNKKGRKKEVEDGIGTNKKQRLSNSSATSGKSIGKSAVAALKKKSLKLVSC